jgi:sialic acid synthase SpsE
MQLNKFNIGLRIIDSNEKPYLIAEAGSNFNQNFDTACKLINVAAEAGADAVKFQLFDSIALYPGGGEIFDVFKSVELNPEWIPKLSKYAQDQNIDFLASAFDKKSVDILETANVVAYKIASSEITNLPLLHYIASKKKPMIISTGMSDLVDIEEAINVSVAVGNNSIALLQCGVLYPLPIDLANLKVISSFIEKFKCPVGFSDHTLENTSALIALGLGARIFEKHFTLDRKSKGPDHFYALEPNDLKIYFNNIQEGFKALGNGEKEMLEAERQFGRREGLYINKKLSIGAKLGSDDIDIRRPAIGLRSRYASLISNAILRKNLNKGDPITWDSVEF